MQGTGIVLALYAVAAQLMHGLWRQADVGTDRNAAFGQETGGLGHAGTPFELDHLRARSHQAGGVSEGGSTITQQLAGTLYLDRSEISISRKIKELWWALQLERRYSKDEILELYLNKMYFGGGTYGVNAASNPKLTPLKALEAPKVEPSSLNSKKVVDLMTQAGLL